MRRTASEVIRSLEMRVARLERQSSGSEYIREYLRQNPHMSREEALEFMLEQGMEVGHTPSKMELTIAFTSPDTRNEKRFVKAVSNLGLPLTSSPKHKPGGALYLHFLPTDFSKFWRMWLRTSPMLIKKHGITISQIYMYDGRSFFKGEDKISSHLNLRSASLKRLSSNKIKLEVVKYIDNFYGEYYEMIEDDPDMEGAYGEEGVEERVSSKTVKDFKGLLRELSDLKREFDSEFEWEDDLRDYLTGRSKKLPKLVAYVEQDYFMEAVVIVISSEERFSKDQLGQITESL